MEDRGFDIDATANGAFDHFDLFAVAAEEKHFCIGIGAEELGEPDGAGVVVEIVVGLRTAGICIGFEFGLEKFSERE